MSDPARTGWKPVRKSRDTASYGWGSEKCNDDKGVDSVELQPHSLKPLPLGSQANDAETCQWHNNCDRVSPYRERLRVNFTPAK
jgi:hypothetical protein